MRYLLISLCVAFGLSACEKPLPEAPSKKMSTEIPAPTTVDPPVEKAPAVKPAEATTATDLEELEIQAKINFCSMRVKRVDCETKIRQQAAIEKVLAKDVATNCITLESNMAGGPSRKVCAIEIGLTTKFSLMTQMCYMITGENEYPVDCAFYSAIHRRVADLEK